MPTHYELHGKPRVFLIADGVEHEIKTSGPLSIEWGTDNMLLPPELEYTWTPPALMDFSVEVTKFHLVNWLRLFVGRRAKISRRKVWRYMEHKRL